MRGTTPMNFVLWQFFLWFSYWFCHINFPDYFGLFIFILYRHFFFYYHFAFYIFRFVLHIFDRAHHTHTHSKLPRRYSPARLNFKKDSILPANIIENISSSIR